MNKVVDVIALEKKVKERTEAERKAVAKNLRSIREGKKISQNAAAELCGMSERHYGKIERGEANFTIETRVKLCVGLGIAPYDLLGDLVTAVTSCDIE